MSIIQYVMKGNSSGMKMIICSILQARRERRERERKITAMFTGWKSKQEISFKSLPWSSFGQLSTYYLLDTRMCLSPFVELGRSLIYSSFCWDRGAIHWSARQKNKEPRHKHETTKNAIESISTDDSPACTDGKISQCHPWTKLSVELDRL